MSILAPRLTALDRRVLACLPAAGGPGKRLADTFKVPAATPRCGWHGRQYGCGESVQCEACGKALDFIADAYEEHCEILRGLEACGYAVCRGGWWRRA